MYNYSIDFGPDKNQMWRKDRAMILEYICLHTLQQSIHTFVSATINLPNGTDAFR